MKFKIAIVALILIGFSACTQRTCPTYAKSDSDLSKPQTKQEAKV